MKKNYNLTLLSLAIALLITQVANYVLQNYFGGSRLTVSSSTDMIFMIVIAFIFLIQFNKYRKVISILAIVYGGFNIIYGLSSNYIIRQVVINTEAEVLSVLGLLIGHILFEVAALFMLVQNTQPRFENKFTSRLVLVTLTVSLVMLIAISPFLTANYLGDVLRQVVAVGTIGLFYVMLFISVMTTPQEETTIQKEPLSDKDKKLEELSKLLSRGIISQDEFDLRKAKIEEIK